MVILLFDIYLQLTCAMNIDAILYFDQNIISEDGGGDIRSTTSVRNHGYNMGPAGMINRDDPKMYMATNIGRQLQSSLNGIGNGFWAEVSDFGKYVTVTAGCHNTVSGRSATKTFVIVFEKNGIGTIFNSSTKWRTISGVGQAASYIRSMTSAIEGNTSNKI